MEIKRQPMIQIWIDTERKIVSFGVSIRAERIIAAPHV